MDPKPFRCVYDPELSRSKSQGSKPIYTKPRAGQPSDDPRPGRVQSGGKRVVPKNALSLPKFARSAVKPLRRCLLTGIGPLVSRSRLYDLVRQYGAVEDCQIVVSRSTGASLGIAWVIFGPNETGAADSLVKSSEQGLLDINDQGSRVNAKLDVNGALLREAEQAAERTRLSRLSDHSADSRLGSLNENMLGTAGGVSSFNGNGSASDDLRMVELRSLNPAQVTKWYERFVGNDASYVLLRDVCLSVYKHSVEDIARAFREFPVKHIAVNKTGFFICFDRGSDAVDCFLKMNRKFLFGVPLRLKTTFEGRRLSNDEVLEYRKNELKHQRSSSSSANGSANGTRDSLNGSSNGSANGSANGLDKGLGNATIASSKTLRPGSGIPPHAYDEAADRIISDLAQEIKRKAWPSLLAGFVNGIVEEELRKMWDRDDEAQAKAGAAISDGDEESDSESVSNEESRESTPASQAGRSQAVGLGTRRGGAVGMTARALPGYGIVRPFSQLPGLRIRKRMSETPAPAPASKKRKPLQVTASAPNSYIRAPIQAVPANGSVKLEIPSKEDVEMPDEDHDAPSDGMLKPELGSDEGHEDDIDLEESEESDEEERGMALPVSPISETDFAVSGPVHNRIQKLVRSKEDYTALKELLNTVHLDPMPEESVIEVFTENFKPRLRRDDSINWPLKERDVPFRLQPYHHRNDDERRQYLRNLGPGVPNEIVQSYKERPLYEGVDEIEEEELRTETRALNVSRSAFGVNADLFADDNLSKNAKDTRLARSAIHDWGLYANEQIPANDFVLEYVGDVLRDEYAEIRERDYAMEGIDSTYLFRLDNGTVIDATKRGNGARFINHSCDPNCTAQVFDYEGYKRVVLFSLRDIEPDEELTFDYNFVRSQDENGKVRCACGAANCRGWLM